MQKLKAILGQKKQSFFWFLSQKKINRRIKEKIANGQKIRVIFVCHRPSVWGALETVYEAFCRDSFFDTCIITIPQRDMTDPEKYMDEGANAFFKKYNPIVGYSASDNSFLDIKTLEPDIVFYQQPYDVMREDHYHSNRVSTFAKIGYVSYFSIFPDYLNDDDVLNTCYPIPYLRELTYFFSQNAGEQKHVTNLLHNRNIRHVNVCLSGYPKYDNMRHYARGSTCIASEKKSFNILWTPRWTTNEHNCHFFAYKDNWFSYCTANKDIDFVFRPHPQSWIEWRTTGEFTEKKQEEFRSQYSQIDNMSIDESGDYLATFYSSDCLVSDMSSMIFQYLLTGKPVVFCHNLKSINSIRKETPIGEALYYAESWEEVEHYLNMLRHGEDPLSAKRKEIIQTEFLFDKDITSGEKIKEIIKKDLLIL